jgi:hypothetical protein
MRRISSHEGRRPGDAGRLGASAVPAGRPHQPAPGRSGHHACRHYDRRAGCAAGSGGRAGGHIRRVGKAPTKPGPDRTKGPHTPWAEPWWNAGRRARPKRKGGASRLLRGAPCAPLRTGSLTAVRLTAVRLPALHVLHFISSLRAERSKGKQSSLEIPLWTASSRSLSSGRALRADPLAPRNDGLGHRWLGALPRETLSRGRDGKALAV